MGNEELKARLTELLPAAVFEESADTSTSAWINMNIEQADWLSLAEKLHDDDSLLFNYLFCLTCIDWKTHLTMVYHLTSTTFRHHVVVKAKLDPAKPEIGSVAGIWKTANFHEREVYELFGVNFLDHPDLRLLILPDGWEGKNPLRKNFEDPVNMIKL